MSDYFDIEMIDEDGKHTYMWSHVAVDGKYITFACPYCKVQFIIKKSKLDGD